MNKARFGWLLKFMAVILFIGTVLQPVGGGASAESAKYKDGEYDLPYTIFKKGTTEVSVMEAYVLKPAKLKVEGGKNYVSITLKQSAETTGFKLTTAEGILSEGSVVNSDNNQRTIRFEIGDLTASNNGWVKIDIDSPQMSYHETYDVDFKFDPSAIPAAVITPVEPVLQDGQYTIAYSVLHATKEQESSMKAYLGSPATLDVKNGQKTLSLNVIKQSSVVKAVYLEGVEATTISENLETDTRVVSVPVSSLSNVLPGGVHVSMTTPVYNMKHDVRFKFNLDSITVVSLATPTPTPSSSPSPSQDPGTGVVDGGTKPDPVKKESFNYLDFTILKKGTNETSKMNEYVEHPGTLVVLNGEKYLAIKLNNSKEITGFIVDSGATKIAASAGENTRTMMFAISDVGTKVNGWVEVNWPEINYFHSYDVDIRVSSTVGGPAPDPRGKIDSPTPAATATAVASATPAPIPAPTPAASAGTKGTGNSTSVSLKDVSGHWAQAAIEKAIKSGIVKGYDDNSFRPNHAISRAELAVLLSRVLKFDSSAAKSSAFSDERSIPAWAADGVAQIAAQKIISGYEDGSFRADRKISRAELAVIIARAKGLTIDASAVPTFSDAKDIAAWAKPYIAAAEKAGLISGKGSNQFAPDDYATRAEVISLLVKFLEQ